MSDGGPPEFSRRVPLARLGTAPLHQDIVAGENERLALSRRFGLLSLDRLTASIELERRGGGLILMQAAIEAEFVQECVVTLDPVAGTIGERFALLYGPPEAEVETAAGDDIAFEPLAGEAIDIGEAVAQEFSLRLPAFPRRSDACAEIAASQSEPGPFAALSQLVERRRR